MLRPLGSTYSSMHCPKSFVVFISRDHVLKLNMCLLHSDLVVMHVHNVCLDSCPGEEKKMNVPFGESSSLLAKYIRHIWQKTV